MKKLSYISLILFVMSCKDSRNVTENPDFYRSKSDSIHANHIEANMIPMYSVAGNVNRMTIPEMMQQDNIPGMSIAFIDHGEIAWTKHYGYANIEDSIPVDSETVFTGASLSKPITAIAALRLVEKGLLSLHENVNLQLKDWKVPETELTVKEKVTLRRLIGHSAGIKNDLWNNYLSEENMPSLQQMLAGEKPSTDPAASVISVPGSKTKYSNTGYSIIQQLLMDVKDEAFDQIIKELVFDPVGMESSSFKQPIPEDLMQRRATGYSEDLEAYPYQLFPYQAAGGVWTTSTDMAKFMITLLDDYQKGSNTLVSKEMAQSFFKKNIDRYVFSLWDWGEDIVFMHYGSNQGFNCIMYGSIDQNQGIVVMTNSDNSFAFFDYIQRAVNSEYDWAYVQPEILDPIEADINWVDVFLGEYEWRNHTVSFHKDKQNLLLHMDDETYVLTQTDERVFIFNEKTVKITFPKSIEGKITFWESNGYPYRVKKTSKD